MVLPEPSPLLLSITINTTVAVSQYYYLYLYINGTVSRPAVCAYVLIQKCPSSAFVGSWFIFGSVCLQSERRERVPYWLMVSTPPPPHARTYIHTYIHSITYYYILLHTFSRGRATHYTQTCSVRVALCTACVCLYHSAFFPFGVALDGMKGVPTITNGWFFRFETLLYYDTTVQQ